jgi:hypothetical protein
MRRSACIRCNFGYTTLIMHEKLVTFIHWRGGLSPIHYFIMPWCNWRLSYMSQNHYKLKRCKEIKVIQQDALTRITPQSMNRFSPIIVECVLHDSITHKTLESRCHRTTHVWAPFIILLCLGAIEGWATCHKTATSSKGVKKSKLFNKMP